MPSEAEALTLTYQSNAAGQAPASCTGLGSRYRALSQHGDAMPEFMQTLPAAVRTGQVLPSNLPVCPSMPSSRTLPDAQHATCEERKNPSLSTASAWEVAMRSTARRSRDSSAPMRRRENQTWEGCCGRSEEQETWNRHNVLNIMKARERLDLQGCTPSCSARRFSKKSRRSSAKFT